MTSLEGHSEKLASGCNDYAVQLVKQTPEELARTVIGPRKTVNVPAQITMKEWAPKECADQTLRMNIIVGARQSITP
ncbi:hypothetical protein [Kineococcus sp. SYSU DK004]|uniref:hypothetical protein n=1 Tax=Kineococcus sp. SYSU DK004 TaxID=3383125 RepID=UPI003D7EB36F